MSAGSLTTRLSPRATLTAGLVLVTLAFVFASARGAYAIAPQQLATLLWEGLIGQSTPSPEHRRTTAIRSPQPQPAK